MPVSERFAQFAEHLDDAPYFLPCRCGQVHVGGRPDLDSRLQSVHCTICRRDVYFDLAHVGRLPMTDRIVKRSDLHCIATTLNPNECGLEMYPGLRIAGRLTWRITPSTPPHTKGERMLAVFDTNEHLLHLGLYMNGALSRGVFLHQESGFIQYRSPNSLITYERGLVEGPLMPRFAEGDSVAIVHRSYPGWCRRLVRRVIKASKLRQRRRISRYPH